jgi:hypothetical protein
MKNKLIAGRCALESAKSLSWKVDPSLPFVHGPRLWFGYYAGKELVSRGICGEAGSVSSGI